MGKIKVIVKRPDEKYGHVTYMSNTLEAFQKAVGGYIETISMGGSHAIIVNEEGKLLGLQPNFKIGSGLFADTVVGTAVLVGVDGDEFTDIGISFETWKALMA